MKNNKLAKMLLALGIGVVTATSSVAFAACSPQEQEQETTYTVTYNLGYTGATGTPQPDTGLKSGDKATKPADPTRDGYTFDGWFTADGSKWDFNTGVTANMTLTAKWTANSTTGGEGTTPGTGGEEETPGTGGEGTTPGTGGEGTTPGGTTPGGGSTGGEGTTPGGTTGGEVATTTTTLVDVDFKTATAKDPIQANEFNFPGLTLHTASGEKIREQSSLMGLNLGGAGTLTNRSVSFNVEHKGKVEVTVTYTGDTDRYLELFHAITVQEDDHETQQKEVIATGKSKHAKGKGETNIETIKFVVWTEKDNEEIYLGPNNGLDIHTIKVDSTYNNDNSAMAAAPASLLATYDKTDVVLVEDSVNVDLNSVEVVTDGYAILDKLPGTWTLDTKLYSDSACTQQATSVTATGTYYIKATAGSIASNVIPVTVRDPQNKDLTYNNPIPKTIGRDESNVSFNAATEIGLKIAGVVPGSRWTVTYTKDGDSTGTWTLGQGSHTIQVEAKKGTTITLSATVTVNVEQWEAETVYKATYTYKAAENTTLTCEWDKNKAGEATLTEDETVKTATARAKSTSDNSASYTNYKELKTMGSAGVTIVIPSEAKAGSVKITAYVSHTSSGERQAYINNTTSATSALASVNVTKDHLFKLEVTGKDSGTYYLFAGSSTIHLYAVIIEYTIVNE